MAVETERRYGGDLVCIPLSSLIRNGRGDDVFVVVDHEHHSRYGVLGIGNNATEYRMALKKALEEETRKLGPTMIAVQDPESGSPMMLAHEMIYGGKKHYLAVVFNASFADNPEENSDGSFCLRLSSTSAILISISSSPMRFCFSFCILSSSSLGYAFAMRELI